MSLFRRIKYYSLRPCTLIEDAERWLAYRTYDKYHVVATNLEPGYYDKPETFLHVVFSLLEDFVECECASYTAHLHKDKLSFIQKLELKVPLTISRMFFPDFKCRELGLLHIQERRKLEASNFDVGGDSETSAKYREEHIKFWTEVEDLYRWWKDVYSKYEETLPWKTYYDFHKKIRKSYGGVHKFVRLNDGSNCSTMKFLGDDNEEKEYNAILSAVWAEEERQEKETEDNLIRLVKIRRSLWT